MRCLSPRGLFVQWVACLSLWLGGIQTLASADDSAPVVEDHPILVVTAASIDRLLDRGALLSELAGGSLTKEALATATFSKDGDLLLKGIDLTKPAGVMVFFSLDAVLNRKPAEGDAADDEKEQAKEDASRAEDAAEPDQSKRQVQAGVAVSSEDGVDVFFNVFEQALGGLAMERGVAFIPVANFDELLEAWKLTPIPDKAGLYQQAEGAAIVARRIGNYLLIGADADLVAHCPDPRSIVRPLLGKHDLVVSFQTKGLPVGLRTFGAEAFKLAYAATLQQQDDEPKSAYELRRATGNLLAELLDLALSHIDAVNLGLRIDPEQKQLVTELDVVGAENGKLAKFAKEWTPKRSPFAGLWQDDGQMSLGLSLAFPERHARPIANALRVYVRQIDGLDEAALDLFGPLIHVGAKLIETGQLDVLFTSTGSDDNSSAILGIRVPGGPQFPEQFQRMLEHVASLKWNDADLFGIAVDSVNGLPVHRLSNGVLKELFDWTVADKDQSDGGLSLVATSDAIWLATTGKENRAVVPDLLKLAVEHASSKSPRPAGTASGKVSPFRMTIHTRAVKSSGVEVDAVAEEEQAIRQVKGEAGKKVRQAQLEQAEREKQEQERVYAIFQDRGDAIHVELRPSATGLKLTIQFEEAFLAVYGHYLVQGLSGGEDGDTND